MTLLRWTSFALRRHFIGACVSRPVRLTTQSLQQFALVSQRVISSTARERSPPEVTWPPYRCAETQWNRLAVRDHIGMQTYGQLVRKSLVLEAKLKKRFGENLSGKRICLLCPSDASFVVGQWATWLCGAASVPVSLSHPLSHVEYVLENSGCDLLLAGDYGKTGKLLAGAKKAKPDIKSYVIDMEKLSQPGNSDILDGSWYDGRPEDEVALLIYTSGTTGKPKGAYWKHGALRGQADMMSKCWGWQEGEQMLHVLPLHHVHGLLKGLLTPLAVGASVHMMPAFDPLSIWKHLTEEKHADGDPNKVFTGVPTVYVKLLQYYRDNIAIFPPVDEIRERCLSNYRLMLCGSAPLPNTILHEWHNLTGHTLLERYGMTEIGMAISNPLEPASSRTAGSVGQPMPGVSLQIRNEDSKKAQSVGDSVISEWPESSQALVTKADDGNESSGHLLIKSKAMFSGYWNNETATKKTFTNDGWFITGDIAEYDVDGDYIKLLGRDSVDIIKSGGYKISALDVERELIQTPGIREIAVVGVPDDVYGERVAAIVALDSDLSVTTREGAELSSKDILQDDLIRTEDDTLQRMREFGKQRLPNYQLPSICRIMRSGIPRNIIGKVEKKQLLKDISFTRS